MLPGLMSRSSTSSRNKFPMQDATVRPSNSPRCYRAWCALRLRLFLRALGSALGSARDSERWAEGILLIVQATVCSRTKRFRLLSSLRFRAAAAAVPAGLSFTSAAGGAPITKISPKQSASARNSTCAVYSV